MYMNSEHTARARAPGSAIELYTYMNYIIYEYILK